MKHYEIIYLIHPDQSSQMEDMKKRYESLISEHGGQVDWGRRTMAYKIEKSPKAYYVLMNVTCPHEAIVELEKAFRYNDAVIRNMCFATSDAITTPSIMMADKGASSKDRESKQRKRELMQKHGTVDYMDIDFLKGYVADNGKITPSRMSGNNAKGQRAVNRAIKRARLLALLHYCDTHK